VNRVRLVVLVGIALVLVIGVLAVPIKVSCCRPGYGCATAPDAQGYVDHCYEVKPLGAGLIELVTASKFPLNYTSGHELKKVR